MTSIARKSRPYEKHNLKRSKEYRAHSNMLTRCYNPKATYFKDYGSRGIEVCERWRNSFLAFYEDMGVCPDGLTLDRIDNDKNYTPDNCKWSTKTEQALNRRMRKDNSSGHIGIYRVKTGWQAQARRGGKLIHLGTFKDKENAVAVHDKFITHSD